jgi:predicted HicB family RNase H-like nuclease
MKKPTQAFVLRLPIDLKTKLEQMAKSNDSSLNSFITREMRKVVAKSKAS